GSPREQRFEFIKMMLAETPDYQPGSKYVYSNAGYSLLGVIAEQLTNAPWESLMSIRIFQPLGMTTAGFGAMGTKGLLDQPLQHYRSNGRIIAVEPEGIRSDNPVAIAPGGLVHCSMGDWAKFIKIHVAEGKNCPQPLLSEATFRKLHTPLFGGNYVAGWLVVKRGWARDTALTHTGSNTMNYAVVWMAPAINFAVMVATNFGNEDSATPACDAIAASMIKRFLSN